MTGKERVIKAFRCENVDRTPWVPFVGCHAGSLIGQTASEYLKSAENIVKGVDEAVKRYRPDGLPVVFDLQIEAETFGCELNWADENPPAVISHPLSNGTTLGDLKIPGPDQGRIPIAIEAAKQIRKKHPDIALYGLITGPFTLALHIMGTDIFMKMFDAADQLHRLFAFCRDVCNRMSDYYIDAGCDIIAVVDPMTSQIGPEQFTDFITPYATEVFEHIRSKGALGSFFVCGHAQQNVGVMCDCKPDNVSVDENIPLDFVKDQCLQRGISFGGNMQLTTVLLLGDELDSQKNAIACMETAGDKGFILAPGCDLPYATPPANLESVIKVVEDEYTRDSIKAMVSKTNAEDKLNLAEYAQAGKVIVDIITLDSEACAPCQYMVDSVKKVAPQFEGIVEWREHKIKYRESLIFMTSLMVRNIPTICIDGQITFVSRIPPRDELVRAIQNRINEKFRLNIQRRKATLYILGKKDDPACEKVKKNITQAILETGIDVNIQVVNDEQTMHSYGVTVEQTPAVVKARYSLKSMKAVPEVPAIKEWLKTVGG